jgi:dTMP kinase
MATRRRLESLTPQREERRLISAQMSKVSHFPGFLIAIEGIDGAGKTTQAHFLQDRLIAGGFEVIRTKEPTTGKWGQQLRDSALTGRLSIEEEVETFIKDRQEHVQTLILPELKSGKIVIVDRYYFSTVAYQGARGLNPMALLHRNEEFAPEPDLLILLDLDVKEGLQRIRTRGDRANHFEKTNTLRRAREIFLSIKKPYLFHVDAMKDANAVRDLIVEEFHRRYAEEMARSGNASQTELREKLQRFHSIKV